MKITGQEIEAWSAMLVALGVLGAFTRWVVKAVWNAARTMETNTTATSDLAVRADKLAEKIDGLAEVVDGRIGNLESDMMKVKAKLGIT